MSRCKLIESAILASAVSLMALPSLAMADVMEIGAAGPQWLAGGPAGQSALPLPPAQIAAAPSTPVTQVSPAAGPPRHAANRRRCPRRRWPTSAGRGHPKPAARPDRRTKDSTSPESVCAR